MSDDKDRDYLDVLLDEAAKAIDDAQREKEELDLFNEVMDAEEEREEEKKE